MKNADYFKNKKITIVGLGRSGLACANLLCDLGAQISITETQDNALTRSNASKLNSENIIFELGRHSPEFIGERDLVVVSPGVSDTALPVVWAKQFKIPIISEIEVGGILCPATIIAITGTNGKTTVTTLVAKLLEKKFKRVFICGNIGTPFCAELNKMSEDDFVSLEVSSFQLEKIQTFKPKIAVMLNFSRNHLDRYPNLADYLAAKKRIFMNQDESDYLVLNDTDSTLRELAKEAKSKVIYFSDREGLNLNQAASLSVASILGIDKELVLDVFREFKGIEHRLEFVAEINKVKFINDSKATTVDSTSWALKNINEPIVLIAGGRDKGNDYSVILNLMQKKVKEVILIGEAKEKMKDAWAKFLSLDESNSLEEAVGLAFSKADKGDCVLLSPMCASFDMFSDYEARGRAFKKGVFNLGREQWSAISD